MSNEELIELKEKLTQLGNDLLQVRDTLNNAQNMDFAVSSEELNIAYLYVASAFIKLPIPNR